MAKFLKHLGIGGKRQSEQDSRTAYNNQKSCSVQDIYGRISTRENSCHSLAHSITLDRNKRQTTKRPPSVYSNTIGNFVRRSRDIVLRRNSSTGGSFHKEPKAASSDSADYSSEITPDSEDHSSSAPPKLLDDYSEPADVQQIADEHNAQSRTSGGVVNGLYQDPPALDDDYTMPYEIKEIRQEIQLKNTDTPSPNPSQAEDFYALPKKKNPREKTDVRTCENMAEGGGETLGEYDRPWVNNNESQIVSDYEDLRKGDKTTVNDPTTSASIAEPTYTPRHDYVNAEVGQAMAAASIASDPDANQVIALSTFGGARPKIITSKSNLPTLPQNRGPQYDKRVGNYEEPWDLSMTQEKMEECFRKIPAGSAEDGSGPEMNRGETQNQVLPNQGQVLANQGQGKESRQLADTRPMEGYEKPWDWKPDRKDGRPQEGYEKPWDWKQHQKDDRPSGEYDQPWDQNKLQNLCMAKGAKDIQGYTSASLSRLPQRSSPWQGSPGMYPSGGDSLRLSGHRGGHSDMRPMEEYDQPWDQRQNHSSSLLMQRTSSERRQPLPHGYPASHFHPGFQPPRHGRGSGAVGGRVHDMGWSAVGERIDPKLPLKKQGWYHGSISRVEAENILKFHQEGSYLVRISESSRKDYSLSLRSSRGFMHMKIIHRDGKYILGQFSQPFDTIPAMIYNYSVNKLPIKGAEHMSLLYPVWADGL